MAFVSADEEKSLWHLEHINSFGATQTETIGKDQVCSST